MHISQENACLLQKTLADNSSSNYFIMPYTDEHSLFLSWSDDGKTWHDLSGELFFSDYGMWFEEKKMFAPFLCKNEDNKWYCVFTPNLKDPVFAITSSSDLVHWHVQNYQKVSTSECLSPFLIHSGKNAGKIFWHTSKGEYYQAETHDFKTFSAAIQVFNPTLSSSWNADSKRTIPVPVSKEVVEFLLEWQKQIDIQNEQNNETTEQDSVRFEGLNEVHADVKVDFAKTKPISPFLFGIFYEDISYGADGGLYAEMIQNRNFEYNSADKEGWNAKTAWVAENLSFQIEEINPVHKNNPHYAVLTTSDSKGSLTNLGFDGMRFIKDEDYLFSAFLHGYNNIECPLLLEILDDDKNVAGSAIVCVQSNDWKKYEITIVASRNIKNGTFRLSLPKYVSIAADMISLFPRKTFKNRRNGMRDDLAQVIADLKPKFVRFPGGCVSHGNGLENMYRWNRTIGPLEARPSKFNIWGYHQSIGVGYFEYFQFCEDIGAEPLPVVPAGVPCQNSNRGGKGQQGGIPMEQMGNYIQEVLDMVEWANGPVDSKWGKIRAEAGHPEPFHLKFIGVGNEEMISDIFKERYVMICKAIKQKYPEITLVGTVGPFSDGPDYLDGWELTRNLKPDIVDEHYFRSPGWFIHHQHFYDNYDRNEAKVYLGEYAAHLENRKNCVESALAEAIHLASVERNGDVVAMTSYAPLLCKKGHECWNPDLIYFDNNSISPTVGYYVQQLFSLNSGDKYAETISAIDSQDSNVKVRIGVSSVFDTKNSVAVIKLVNILPAKVNVVLSLCNMEKLPQIADVFVLSGKPSDTDVKPVKSHLQIQNNTEIALMPYSLTIIRIENVSCKEE